MSHGLPLGLSLRDLEQGVLMVLEADCARRFLRLWCDAGDLQSALRFSAFNAEFAGCGIDAGDTATATLWKPAHFAPVYPT